MSRPLSSSDRQYAAWLGDVERSVVLPLKWVLLIVTALYWVWVRDWQPPGSEAFGLFFFFVGVTIGEHYFFARDRITPRQVRPFVFGSFLLDALFILALVVLDSIEVQRIAGRVVLSDYTIFFVLLVLRGFALFRTRTEVLGSLGICTAMFALAAWFQVSRVEFLEYRPMILRLALLWSLMLLTQAFIGLVNEQKEEQVRAAERLVRSASLASLGELAAGVAHEINNPIGIIKTYVDYLEKSVGKDDPMHEDFTTIRAEAERCEQIVRRMLDFSNPQVAGFVSVDLRRLVDEVSGFVFHSEGGDQCELEIRATSDIPPVKGDPTQLRQALMNILVNARQMLAEHAEKQPADWKGRVQVVLQRATGPRPPVRLEVRDNGPGISPEDAERAFEPFFTRRRRGTGFGLAITRRIIEVHGGTIRIGPLAEGGAVVTVELPIEGEEEA